MSLGWVHRAYLLERDDVSKAPPETWVIGLGTPDTKLFCGSFSSSVQPSWVVHWEPAPGLCGCRRGALLELLPARAPQMMLGRGGWCSGGLPAVRCGAWNGGLRDYCAGRNSPCIWLEADQSSWSQTPSREAWGTARDRGFHKVDSHGGKG